MFATCWAGFGQRCYSEGSCDAHNGTVHVLRTVNMRQSGFASICEGKGLRDTGPEQCAGAAEEGGGGEVSAVPACMGATCRVRDCQAVNAWAFLSGRTSPPSGMQVA